MVYPYRRIHDRNARAMSPSRPIGRIGASYLSVCKQSSAGVLFLNSQLSEAAKARLDDFVNVGAATTSLPCGAAQISAEFRSPNGLFWGSICAP